jgi:hypothetical protein
LAAPLPKQQDIMPPTLHPLLQGLPSLEMLLRPKVDTAETFSNVQLWVRSTATQGQMEEAGRRAGRGYRCAILYFLDMQTLGGIRRNKARDLIKVLAGSAEWAAEASLSTIELATAAEEACKLPPPASARYGAEWDAICEDNFRGLPAKSNLEDPQGISASDTFRSLQTWVKNRRQAGKLVEAATLIDPSYRRSIFSFTRAFADQKPVFRSRAQELSKELATFDEWCQDEAIDQAERAEALAVKPGRPMGVLSRDTNSAQRYPAPWDGVHRMQSAPLSARRASDSAVLTPASAKKDKPSVFLSPRLAPSVPEGVREALPSEDTWVRQESAPAEVGRQDLPIPNLAGRGKALGGSPDLLVKITGGSIPQGLPPRHLLQDSQANIQKEVFQSLRAWVRAKRHAGNLAEAGALLDEDTRASIFHFLNAFIARKTVFREQARGIFELLAGLPQWECEKTQKVGERPRADSEASTVSALSSGPPSTSESSSNTSSFVFTPPARELNESADDVKYQGHCDRCKMNLVPGDKWYHKRGSYEDMCLSHWRELPEVDQAAFINICEGCLLGGEKSEYVYREDAAAKESLLRFQETCGAKVKKSHHLYLTPFLDKKFKGLRVFRHVLRQALPSPRA